MDGKCYVQLEFITSYGDKPSGCFRYSTIEAVCNDPNFAVLRCDHFYPLPSAESYTLRLHEARENLVDQLLLFGLPQLLALFKSMKSGKKTTETSVVKILSDEEESNVKSSDATAESDSSEEDIPVKSLDCIPSEAIVDDTSSSDNDYFCGRKRHKSQTGESSGRNKSKSDEFKLGRR